MLSTISSMIRLCPDEKKAFFQNLYVSYERDLAQYGHDMGVLVQIKDYFAAEKWRECGLLLEQEIRNNPSTVAWYVYMALIKTRIDPSYDCEQEFYALNKYFNQKNYKIEKKKFDGKYYHSYNFSIWEKNGRPTHYFYVSSTLNSLLSYSRRFTSLLFLPYNIVVGALCGIKIPIVGIVLVPICAVGVFIRHIIQLAYITKPRFFRKIIQKVIQSKQKMFSLGDCFYSFAQISYCEKINEAFLDFWDLLEIPIGLISLG
jgi:hypothetical protein